LPPPEQRGVFAKKPDKLSERSEFLSGRKSSALMLRRTQTVFLRFSGLISFCSAALNGNGQLNA